jgi:hypothetical protein
MSRFTPNKDISDSYTIITLEKNVSVELNDVDVYIDVCGESETFSVSPGEEDLDVSMDLDVEDLEYFNEEQIDALLSGLVKYHPELMGSRIFGCVPTDTDAIKALMERLDEINGKHAVIGAELGAIRRAAGMLTVAAPADEQPVNK